MPLELVLLAVTLGLALLVGVPAIRLGLWVPRHLKFETVPDDQLTTAQRAHYERLDVRLAPLAYFPRLTFATNLQGATLSRVYLCDHDTAILGAHCLRGANVIDERQASGTNYMEWITRYEDGTTLMTQNVELSEVFDRMPQQIKQKFVGVSDPKALKLRHDRRAAELLSRQPRNPHRGDMLAEYREHHVRFCDFQASRGLLLPVGPDDRHRVTVKTALRGVLNFFNPLADNFTLPRFAAAVLFGAGLPLLVTWLLDPQAPGRPAGLPLVPPIGALVRWIVLGIAYGVSGAVVGYVFNAKQLVWAALLGYLPLRLLEAPAGPAALAALWMAVVAERVAHFRQRRETLV
jgi:hypothetical protein